MAPYMHVSQSQRTQNQNEGSRRERREAEARGTPGVSGRGESKRGARGAEAERRVWGGCGSSSARLAQLNSHTIFAWAAHVYHNFHEDVHTKQTKNAHAQCSGQCTAARCPPHLAARLAQDKKNTCELLCMAALLTHAHASYPRDAATQSRPGPSGLPSAHPSAPSRANRPPPSLVDESTECGAPAAGTVARRE